VAWDVRGRAGEVRAELHAEYPVAVRVRCARCRRILDTLYGNERRPSRAYWEGRFPYTFTAGAPRSAWRCRCGAHYPVRIDKLTAAYRAAAAKSSKQDRVIWLPRDVRGLEVT
jgi:hypothetical protein